MITFSKSNGKSGDGGDTPLGTGGPGNGLAGAGANGTGYGSGGSGASVGYNQSVGQAGGQGMPGVVIIEEYA
ncbi:hypothetical protein AA0616_2994 [Komagataeibacter nataicola NRIC 0616]|nr:hypothetical protein AA0616_2994 [Komagataeibacter nataicola NRIC 0616]